MYESIKPIDMLSQNEPYWQQKMGARWEHGRVKMICGWGGRYKKVQKVYTYMQRNSSGIRQVTGMGAGVENSDSQACVWNM